MTESWECRRENSSGKRVKAIKRSSAIRPKVPIDLPPGGQDSRPSWCSVSSSLTWGLGFRGLLENSFTCQHASVQGLPQV